MLIAVVNRRDKQLLNGHSLLEGHETDLGSHFEKQVLEVDFVENLVLVGLFDVLYGGLRDEGLLLGLLVLSLSFFLHLS